MAAGNPTYLISDGSHGSRVCVSACFLGAAPVARPGQAACQRLPVNPATKPYPYLDGC